MSIDNIDTAKPSAGTRPTAGRPRSWNTGGSTGDPAGGSIASSAMSDYVVPPAMLAVAVACGLASHMHVGFPAEFSAAIGLALFCIMLLGHVLLRPGDRIEINDRAAADVTLAMQRAPRAARPSATSEAAAHDAGRKTVPPAPAEHRRPPALQQAVPPPSLAQSPAAEPSVAALSALVPKPALQKAMAEVPIVPALPPSLPPSVAAAEPASKQQWTYRPLDLQLPVRVDADKPADDPSRSLSSLRPTMAEGTTAAPTFGTAPLSEPERVEQILKRLAAQIRAGGDPLPANPLLAAAPAAAGAADGRLWRRCQLCTRASGRGRSHPWLSGDPGRRRSGGR